MKKFTAFLLVFLLAAALLCGCSAKEEDLHQGDGSFYAIAPENREEFISTETSAAYNADDSALYYSANLAPATGTAVSENRKLIREMSLRVETEAFDSLLSQIEGKISQCGGYAENTKINADYRDLRNASMTIRIPADRLEDFAGQISEISNVVYRTESNKDITTQYVDTKSHRDALKVEQERLLALLGKAENLTEILEIERRLTEVRYELESMEATLRTYDNQVEYATIYLDISEVKVYTETEEKGFWENLVDRFMDSLEGLGDFFVTLFSFLVIALPYLVLFVAVPLLILFVLLRRKKKRNANRKEKSEEID